MDNKGMHQEIFPTHIFRWPSVLDMKEWDKATQITFKDKQRIRFLELEEKIHEAVKEIMSIHCIKPSYIIEITEMWGNILKPGEDHKYHNHPNNIYSGIFYLTGGEPTIFVDPRGSNNMFFLDHDPNRFVDNMVIVEPVPNTLIMFNSWLSHYVGVNKTLEDRKTISFNVILRGNYGMPNSLSEVRI